ncbi:MAG: hypothetical protein COA57_06020 [Flavobacteriales bacterium]|nr:MAG: hypothetical protein COA57_06020 [Flavobacteriales bacterium]
MKNYIYAIILCVSAPGILPLMANKVKVATVANPGSTTITFDLSWDNSWRNSDADGRHDAIWVFIKYADCSLGDWAHANLAAAGHTAAAPLEIRIVTDNKGVFIRRNTASTSGNVTATAISLEIAPLPAGPTYHFKVIAIEMVYAVGGSFELGDGTSNYYFKDGSSTGVGSEFTVSSEALITVGTAAGNLNATSLVPPSNIPAAFPKGFNGFYIMKTEISQGQYADFLNTITTTQSGNRWVNTTGSRNTITGSSPGFVASVPSRAANYLLYMDLLAYLDWAALRPMTELEFEKVCRGSIASVAGEYAWGSTTLHATAFTIDNPNTSSETPTVTGTTDGIAQYSTTDGVINGPIRVGYAATSTSTRSQASEGYYGTLDLSGLNMEIVISTASSTGLAFTGVLGDGDINVANGEHNVTNWPTTGATGGGCGLRGGSWNSGSAYLRVSDRWYANTANTVRTSHYGGRGVRQY